jgi:Kef-type K+ transport system membrane component KefB
MFQTIMTIHGHWRWVLAVVAVVAIVKFLAGWLGKGKVTQLDKTIATAFAGAMTVQLVLGLINIGYVLSLGTFNPRLHGEHLVTGLIAVGLSHAVPMRKDDRPDTARFRSGVILTAISLIASVLNVVLVRGGWMY